MDIIGKRKIFYLFSGLLCLTSLILVFVFGLKLGIDFTGGSLMEVQFLNINRPLNQEIKDTLRDLSLEGLEVNTSGDNGMILKFQ